VDGTADINLALLNRLDEKYSLTVEGDPAIRARGIGQITESFTSTTARDVFIYQATHQFSESGYTISLTCTP